MPLVALMFPATALRRSTLCGLTPLFESLAVLQPPSLGPEALAAPAAWRDVVQVRRPRAGADQAAVPQAQQAAKLLRQWEQWVRLHQGSGQLEAIKAGVQPPPPPETFRSLMGQIKNYRGAGSAAGPSLPQVEADLFLHLAHIQDQEAAGLEEALAQARQSQERLSRSMGHDQADHQPADYETHLLDRLPPVDYSLPQEHLLEQRLNAWATLAAEADLGQAWLATASSGAARLLLERAAALLQPPVKELRSPAGAVSPLQMGPLSPHPDNPLAQEAARLLLSDLSGLDDAALLSLANKLAAGDRLPLLRQRLDQLAQRLSQEKWSQGLARELAQEAQALAANYAALLDAAGAPAAGGQRGLSLLAFPGLQQGDLLALMRGDRPQNPPQLKDWPDTWPSGSCPVWALW